MSRGKALFTEAELNRLIESAQKKGAPAVDIIKGDLVYRIHIKEPAAPAKKPVAYGWESADKEREIIL